MAQEAEKLQYTVPFTIRAPLIPTMPADEPNAGQLNTGTQSQFLAPSGDRKPAAIPAKVRWSSKSRIPQAVYAISAKKVRTPAGSAPPHCPPPRRRCPHRIFKAHEIHPDDDDDWTISEAKGDWDKEKRLRWDRNLMIKEMLLAGISVQYKSSGGSLYPWVVSGDCCRFEPVYDCNDLRVNWDVVFCEVQPYNRFSHTKF